MAHMLDFDLRQRFTSSLTAGLDPAARRVFFGYREAAVRWIQACPAERQPVVASRNGVLEHSKA